MTAAEWLISVMWVALTAYVLFGGADFGAGFWDMLAGTGGRGRARRNLIDRSIAPVWEANHVWLIFVIVLCWTGFPTVFAAVASTMYLPLTGAALGIIARGAAFAFRKAAPDWGRRRLLDTAFSASSILTPYFLGSVAGGIASGRVPPGIGEGDIVTSWFNPTSCLTGILTVGSAAYLAAVYLCGDARRSGQARLAEEFRTRALAASFAVGTAALLGLVVVRWDALLLFRGLTTTGLPVVLLSAAAGVASMALVWTRRYAMARIAAGGAAAALLWGWAVAQYPLVLPPRTTIDESAALPAVLRSTLAVAATGMAVLLPSLLWMYALFQRGTSAENADAHGR